MPVYRIEDALIFPDPNLAREDGMLGVGGDLSVKRLLMAYKMGIFPWYSQGQPICWWSPDPRFVLYPEHLKVSKSMRQLLRKAPFQVSFDTKFENVMRACKNIYRPGEIGSWIDEDMIKAYKELHHLGMAHSIEVWQEGRLVGGLYGVSIGAAFFGESMFARASNASKYGFIVLVRWLQDRGFRLIDCQMHTDHLESLGATMIPRMQFMDELKAAIAGNQPAGQWSYS
ncbi:MAG: leucyl/phenylalanyl-tRNA--protein transferase [Salibacteraceae bacterium]